MVSFREAKRLVKFPSCEGATPPGSFVHQVPKLLKRYTWEVTQMIIQVFVLVNGRGPPDCVS